MHLRDHGRTVSKTTATKKPSMTRDGVKYDLTAQEAAETLGWSIERIRIHAAVLGGRKEVWGFGNKRPASFRFPSKGLKKKAKAVEEQMAANRRSRTKAA